MLSGDELLESPAAEVACQACDSALVPGKPGHFSGGGRGSPLEARQQGAEEQLFTGCIPGWPPLASSNSRASIQPA